MRSSRRTTPLPERVPYPNFDGTQNCAGYGVDLFYSQFSGTQGAEELRLAREMCSDCPILAECGAYALRHELHGFWAGMTQLDRRRIRQATGVGFYLTENFSNVLDEVKFRSPKQEED